MVSVYKDEDFISVYKQRNKILCVFIVVTAVYLALCGAGLAYFISLPYNDPMGELPKWCISLMTVVYLAFAFPFMGIKFKRVNSYYKMLYFISKGIKNEETNFFLGYQRKDLQKDWVDVYSCVFTTWSKKRKEWMNREAYVDVEKTLPDLKQGDLVRYIVRGNFIIQYEVLQSGALDKELEKDEDED